jgi:SAM-dependent methyltransferase
MTRFAIVVALLGALLASATACGRAPAPSPADRAPGAGEPSAADAAGAAQGTAGEGTPDQSLRPDILFVGTPPPVVDAMLDMAGIRPGDVLYDLGSGDGRIPIAAAKRHGIRAVGIEIDPEMVAEARANARKAGVSHLVTFVERDLFLADITEASVVTLYLLDRLNLQLRPKLLRDLVPGTRIVSHQFGMGDWRPEAARQVGRSDVYLWRVPARPAPAPRGSAKRWRDMER